jgi:polysaccharide export outer membrane protein
MTEFFRRHSALSLAAGGRRLVIGLTLAAAVSFPLFSCATSGTAQKAEMVESAELTENLRPADFVLGPGDEVTVKVWRNEDLTVVERVSPYGTFSMPLAGEIEVTNMGVNQLRDTIQTRLTHYLVDPVVSVSVSSYVNQRVFVLGEVNRPGVFPIVGSLTPVEAISAAEGFTYDAASDTVLLVRRGTDKPQLAKLNIKEVLKEGNLSENVFLQGGDIIYVPSAPIADVERFFIRLRNILLPIVTLETGIVLGPLVEDALSGESTKAIVTTH